MSSLEFYRALIELSPERRFRSFLSYRLAPVLDGAKPGELVNFCPGAGDLNETWKAKGPEIISALGLEARVLREREDCSCVLIYDESNLSRSLDLHWDSHLMREAGYRSFSVEGYIDQLKSRFQGNCPHEVGLFLGIPYDDVMGFIRNKGRNSLFDGYWKVYTKPDRARAIFSKYDISKKRTLGAINA